MEFVNLDTSMLPDSIKIKNNELIIDDVPAITIIKKYGTPLFVVSRKQLVKNYNKFHELFMNYTKVLIAYSYKTNYLPSICSILNQEGAGAEVVSGFELFLAMKLGVTPSKIIFNGPGKTDQEITMAIDYDIALINADSLEELERINIIANEMKKTANIGIRIKPNIPDFFAWPKFGLDVDRWAFEAYEKALAMENLNVIGIHAHIGTQICNCRPYVETIRQMTELMHKLYTKLGIKIKYMDIGGGFGVSGFEPLYPIEDQNEEPETLDEMADSIVKELYSCISHYKLSEPILILEPGRSIVTDAAILLTMVETTKIVGKNTKTVVVNGGINLIQFAPYYYHRILPIINNNDSELETVDICGPLCMQLDVIGVNRKLPALKRGDYLAVLDSGAYSLSLSQQFIRPRPPVVLVSENVHKMVRTGESFEDIFRHDDFGDLD